MNSTTPIEKMQALVSTTKLLSTTILPAIITHHNQLLVKGHNVSNDTSPVVQGNTYPASGSYVGNDFQNADDNGNGNGNANLNTTGNGTIWSLTVYSQEHLIATSILLGLFALCCIIGNCFVIAAVILERSLHNVANYLIVSLAVADLMVSVLVMPLSAVSEISKVWFLHQEVCDVWISVDVLCCTASILHLVAISMDRYWAVTGIDYIRKRSAKRILLMIMVVWVVALFISIPPLFGWRDPKNEPEITGKCIISQDKGYTIFSTVGAFYLPMILMMIIYAKIFFVAKSRIRKDKFHKHLKKKTEETTLVASPKTEYTVVSTGDGDGDGGDCNGCGGNNASTTVVPGKKKWAPLKNYGCSPRPERKKRGGGGGNNKGLTTGGGGGGGHNGVNGNSSCSDRLNSNHLTVIEPDPFTSGCDDDANIAMLQKHNNTNNTTSSSSTPSRAQQLNNIQRNKEKLEQKRERKAARTLAIITGAFIICWLPFFIVALIGPFLEDEGAQIPDMARSFILWLGYFNSLLNPIIYTIFSPEFRSAFHKILFGKYRRRSGGR